MKSDAQLLSDVRAELEWDASVNDRNSLRDGVANRRQNVAPVAVLHVDTSIQMGSRLAKSGGSYQL